MAVARVIVDALYTANGEPRLCYHRGQPHLWDGSSWPEFAVRDVRSAAYHFLDRVSYVDEEGHTVPWNPTKRKLDDLMDALHALTLIGSKHDPPLWITPTSDDPEASELVSMLNGLLHVPTRRLLPHTSRFFVRHALPFPFVPDAPAPTRWLDFLGQLWPNDQAPIGVLQEMTGYLLAGGTSLQKMFLFVGPKRGGKGTIGRVLTGLLGQHNVAAPTLAGLATNFGLSPLIGKPLALVADARFSGRNGAHAVIERLLSISGEDTLTIDRKHRDPWTGRLPTRFVILTNELPRLTDASGALTSRFVVFVLTKSFFGFENPRLTDELLVPWIRDF